MNDESEREARAIVKRYLDDDINDEQFVSAIATALRRVREECAVRAEKARLPKGYQWGHDAMEQFNFGKKRAAQAIRATTQPASNEKEGDDAAK